MDNVGVNTGDSPRDNPEQVLELDHATTSNRSALVSFVLPHHGRDELLLQTIQSIGGQRYSQDEIEVIVVSRDLSVSTHSVNETLIERGVSLNLKVVSVADGVSISHARNFGASLAKGSFLAFVDSDVRLSPNWIDTMISSLRQPGVVLVSAVQTPDTDRTVNDVIRSSMSESNVGDTVEALPGANLFMRKTDFDQSAGFPEHLQTCEDSVFTHSLLDRGKLVLTDQAGFVHLGEDTTFLSLFKKEIWRGKSNLDSMQGRKVLLSELPSVIVPFFVLICLLLFAVCLVMGKFGSSLLCLIVALAPCLLYGFRLKIRSNNDLGYHKLSAFYLVYFTARALGMVKRIIEQRAVEPARVKNHE